MPSGFLCSPAVILALLIGCGSDRASPVDAASTSTASGASGAGGSGGAPGTGGGSAGGPPTAKGDAIWARRGDGLGASRAVAAHKDGSIALVGVFRDTIDFGAGPMTSAGENDMFVARLDANGNCMWSRSFGGPQDDAANSVAIDAAGDVILTGGFQGNLQVGSDILTNAGSYDTPLIKLDGQGNPVWVLRFGGPGFDVAWSIAVNPGGSIALLGSS